MSVPNGVPIRAYGVTAFVCRHEGDTSKLLLLRRAMSGRLAGVWGQIWGVIEDGESAWQAALREIREESGIVPDRFYYADICDQGCDAAMDCICVTPVFVGFVDSQQAVVLNEEHSDYQWVTFEEAQALLPYARHRALLGHVRADFADRPPNESLRLHLPDDARSS